MGDTHVAYPTSWQELNEQTKILLDADLEDSSESKLIPIAIKGMDNH